MNITYETPSERWHRRMWKVWTGFLWGILIVGLFYSGYWVRQDMTRFQNLAPERRVASLPGIGSGWIDTLRRVTGGRVEVDTLPIQIIESYNHGNNLVGLYEGWYGRVRVGTDMRFYFRPLSRICNKRPSFHGHFEYRHPPELWNPATVIAHEFGHYYQHVVADTTWKNWHDEIFADRFALTMLAIRGWMDPDTSRMGQVLYHELRTRLWVSRWEEQ